jgi:PAS domain-containing protein
VDGRFKTDPVYLRAVLDLLPAMVLVVDDDVRILDFNRAASGLVGSNSEATLRSKMGDVLHCLHATESPEGCGRGPNCERCVIRTSVGEAIASGTVSRRRAKLELVHDGRTVDLLFLISASPFELQGARRVLLAIDDIGVLAELEYIVAICMRCRKVRIDQDRWGPVENYFKRHWDLDFSHGLCPECATVEMDALNAELNHGE